MRNSQNDTRDDKQPVSNSQADDKEAELPTSDYYYDDSTGYEAYLGDDDESDEAD